MEYQGNEKRKKEEKIGFEGAGLKGRREGG